jgi:hypothetical protein
LDNAGFLQHIMSATGALLGLFSPQHIVKAGLNQDQVIKPHDLHGPCHPAHIACMAGLNQNKTGFHEGKRA